MTIALKRYPEIRDALLSRVARVLQGLDKADVSVLTALLDAIALEDADQHSQLRQILLSRNLQNLQRDDIDLYAASLGALVKKDLRRYGAKESNVILYATDGSTILTTYLVTSVLAGSFNFTVNDASLFPLSGYIVLDLGGSTQESVIYTRVGNVFTCTTALSSSHAVGSSIYLASVSSALASTAAATSTTITMIAGTGVGWPATGTVIVARGLLSEQRIAFTRSGDTLNLSNPGLNVVQNAGTTLHLVSVGFNRVINAGTRALVPSTVNTEKLTFYTLVAGVLYDGDFFSGAIQALSNQVGVETNVTAYTINSWETAPYANAGVFNVNSAYGGSEREDDEPYKLRLIATIQSLAVCTRKAIVSNVIGIKDPATLRVCTYAYLDKPVIPGMSKLYISDGTTSFSIEQSVYSGRDVLINDAVVGARRARLHRTAPYTLVDQPVSVRTPRIFKSVLSGVATSVGLTYLEDTSLAMVVNAHAGKYLLTVDNQFYVILSNSAVRFTLSAGVTPALGAYAIFDFSVDPLIPQVDYVFNKSNGDLELTTALNAHEALVAASDGAAPGVGAYTYTTGLVSYIQKVVNGDIDDYDNYPGLVAHGCFIEVDTPTVVSLPFVFKVIPLDNTSVSQVSDAVIAKALAYINSTGIGADGTIYLSEIVRLCKALVKDFVVISPTSNPVPAANQIIRCTQSDITVV